MKMPDAKASVDKTWWKLEKMPTWQLGKVKSKRDVILEAQKEKKKVHLATWMDICHLKNAELEPKRGDIARDDSGAHAVSTEQDLQLRK